MIQIKASFLGKLKMKDSCPRCLWLTYHFPIKDKHTFYSSMPGIVSIMDSHIKHTVNSALENEKNIPSWLKKAIGEIEIIKPLPPEKWEVTIDKYILNGTPDAIWMLSDETLFIADYKTAKFSRAQEELFPLYETQLNAYAYLAEKNNYKVSQLALIYLQPQNYKENPDIYKEIVKERFSLHFECYIKPVSIWKSSEVENLVNELGEILSQQSPPSGKTNCPSCKGFIEWFEKLKNFV